MKKYPLFLTLCIIAILCSAITTIYYSFYNVKEIKTIAMDVTVGNYVGINADADALHFGTVSPGGFGIRTVKLSNNYNGPLKVSINVYGDIAPLVAFEKNFVLLKNQTKAVAFTASIPVEAALGNYTGKAVFVLKRR